MYVGEVRFGFRRIVFPAGSLEPRSRPKFVSILMRSRVING